MKIIVLSTRHTLHCTPYSALSIVALHSVVLSTPFCMASIIALHSVVLSTPLRSAPKLHSAHVLLHCMHTRMPTTTIIHLRYRLYRKAATGKPISTLLHNDYDVIHCSLPLGSQCSSRFRTAGFILKAHAGQMLEHGRMINMLC